MIKLQPGEKIIAKIRKHWLMFFIENSGIVFVGILPLILLLVPSSFFVQFLPTLDSTQIIALIGFVAAVVELFIFMIFMILLTTYYLDVVIVTDKRILDVEQISLFSRNVVTMPIEKIEDVKIETLGLLAEVFKFGSLDIQTAGEIKEVHVRGIRYPERARDIIMEAYRLNKSGPK